MMQTLLKQNKNNSGFPESRSQVHGDNLGVLVICKCIYLALSLTSARRGNLVYHLIDYTMLQKVQFRQ